MEIQMLNGYPLYLGKTQNRFQLNSQCLWKAISICPNIRREKT